MNTTFRNLSALATAFSMSMAISPAYSQEKGKAKGKEKTGTNGKHGREAGELPYGLERSHGEKRGTSIRIAKKKDEEGQLTRGLEKGGKNLTFTSNAK